MKKNKNLFRCYIGGYFIWAFGVFLAALMMIKFGTGLLVTFIIFAVLALACLISSHVLYNTKKKAFPIPSFIAHGVCFAFVLFGFIFEMVLASKGEPALYAIVMFSACLLFYGLIIFYLIRENRKIMKGIPDATTKQ